MIPMREEDVHPPGGLRLRVCTWGDATKPVVLILHGYLEQGAAWHTVAQRLASAGYRVLAPDHRGHGLSEHLPRGCHYAFHDYAADVARLLDWLGEPVHLVGHSMGGTIATQVGALRPDALRSLTLIEGLGPPDTTANLLDRGRAFLGAALTPPRHGMLRSAEEGAERMRRYNPGIPEDVALALARRTTRPVQPGDPLVRAPDPSRLTWTWDPMHRARTPQPFSARLHTGYLAALPGEVLLIDGADSPFVLDDAAERRAAIPQHRLVVLEGAGHLPHHDRPDALASTLLDHFGAHHG